MKQVDAQEAFAELATLRALCHAFASTDRLDSLSQSTSRWVTEFLGTSSNASLILPDRARRLRRYDRTIHANNIDTRLLRSERQRVFINKVPGRLTLNENRDLLLLPVVSKGESMGLLEVEARAEVLDRGLPALQALAGLAGSVIKNVRPGAVAKDESADARIESGMSQKELEESGRRRERENGDEQMQMEVAWITHELRGPVVGARAALDFLLSVNEPVPHRHMLERAQKALSSLSEYIEPALEWGFGHKVKLERRRIALAELAHRAAGSAQQFAEETRQVLISAPEGILIRADYVQLHRALTSVITSAIVKSPPGTKVRVRVERAAKHALVRVTYQRMASSGTSTQSALNHANASDFDEGLGIFLARRIVDAHGGSLSLDHNGSEIAVDIKMPA